MTSSQPTDHKYQQFQDFELIWSFGLVIFDLTKQRNKHTLCQRV